MGGRLLAAGAKSDHGGTAEMKCYGLIAAPIPCSTQEEKWSVLVLVLTGLLAIGNKLH